MTNILAELRNAVQTAERHDLMYSPPLRTEQARELLVIVDALESDKRRLMAICDDLSAQVNALNQMLQGVIDAHEWDTALAQPLTPDDMREVKRKLASWGTGTWSEVTRDE